jgi:predicted TIM-barrel fold metal-dependent hydrolase
MKIINSHVHLIEIEKALGDDQSRYLEYLKKIPAFEDAESVMEMISLKSLIKQMKEAGIDKSVLFAVQAPVLYSSNEFVSSVCRDYPDKFIGFASVNVLEKNADQALQNAVTKLNLKGLKLHPPLQKFYPNDPMVWPVYKKADELGIPVVFHVGSTPFGNLVNLKQADPILIDEVANEFPGLKIILTHLGTLWHNESFMITEKHPNVYIDTAAYPYEIKELLTEKMIQRVGAHKFIFGTDFPMPYEGKMHHMKDFVDMFNGLKISDELKQMILYKNLENILGEL